MYMLVGNKIIDYTLVNSGYNVINIGVLSSQEDFINAAIETDADLIMVSSLYGHGEIDCRGMRENALSQVLRIYYFMLGGNIVVGKQDFEETEAKIYRYGF